MSEAILQERPSAPRQNWAYVPSVRFSALEIEARNRIFRPRQPVSLQLEDRELRVGQPKPFAGCSDEDWLGLVWSSSGVEFVVALPTRIVERAIRTIQADLTNLPNPETTTMLAELLLADVLDKAESRMGLEIACHGVVRDAHKRCPANGISIPCSLAKEAFDLLAWSRISEPGQRRDFADLLSRFLDHAQSRSSNDLVPPIAVTFVAGRLSIPLATLAGVAVGDVLIPDSFPLAEERVDVLIGTRRHALAKRENEDLKLLSAPRRRKPEERTGVNASNDKTQSARSDAPESLEAIDVDLSFELGRTSIELADLRSLAPGYVFPLGRDPKTSVDILANGRRIGRGEIVSVGDTLGVRVVRLSAQKG